MSWKNLIFLIIFVLASFDGVAQENLVFEVDSWSFGDIHEGGGAVSHSFTAENRSAKPVVILNVVGSCRCVSARFSRKPVLPGEKTEVVITFDPMGHPGTFSKDMGVYTSDRRKVASLTVAGNVLARPKSVEERYPVDAGEGLRLQSSLCSFSYLYKEHDTHAGVGFVNTTDKPLTLELRVRNTSHGLTLTAPRKIAPREQGSIDFGYFFPKDDPFYGTVNDVWEVWVNGKNKRVLLATHGIVVDNPKSQDKNLTPKGNISENIVKFVFDKHKTKVLHHRLTLSNTGRGALIVRAVEHGGAFSTDLRRGVRIEAGGELSFDIAFDARKGTGGQLTGRLLLVTNDPLRPMIRVRMVVSEL